VGSTREQRVMRASQREAKGARDIEFDLSRNLWPIIGQRYGQDGC
jgi:hypothetical protein